MTLSDPLPRPSLIFGGYSNIWGGAVDLVDEKSKHIWGEAYKDLQKSYLEISKFINIHSNDIRYSDYNSNKFSISKREEEILVQLRKSRNKNFEINYSAVALNEKIDKAICLNCNEYKWSCRANSSWTTSGLFSNLINEKKINYIKNAKVIKVSEDKIGNVSVTIIENNRSIVKTYDKVFLGAGAIGTSKIILNSTENICKIELKTNDLISIPYICFSKPFEKLHSFVDLYIRFKTMEKQYFGQLYGFSNNLFKMSEGTIRFANLKQLVSPFLRYSGGGFYT